MIALTRAVPHAACPFLGVSHIRRGFPDVPHIARPFPDAPHIPRRFPGVPHVAGACSDDPRPWGRAAAWSAPRPEEGPVVAERGDGTYRMLVRKEAADG